MAVTLNKANLVLKDANGNIGKIEQLSNRDLAKIRTAMSDVALVVNQSNHKPIAATTTNKGVVQLATPADVVSGASDKVVTAEQLHNATTTIKATQDGAGNVITDTYVKKTGDTLSGTLTYTNNWLLRRNVNSSMALITGGTDWNKSANLQLYGGENTDTPGKFMLMANNGSTRCDLEGKPTGELTWGGLNVLTSNGGNVSSLTYTSMYAMQRDVNNSFLTIVGGTKWDKSAFVKLIGGNNKDDGGMFYLAANDGTNQKNLAGKPTGELTWGGKHIVRSVNGIIADSAGNISLNSSVPIGVVLFYAGTDTPSGYLLCNGGAVSRTTYANLFAKIGTKYGAGDGSTTFNLPNLIDKFAQGSTTVGTVKSAGLPNIIGHIGHLASDSNYVFDGAFSFGESKSLPNMIGEAYHNYAVGAFYADHSNSIYGNSTTVQPPALTLRPIIKY